MVVILGSIDEVNQEISMTWVQPRVLDLSQVLKSLEKFTGHYMTVCMYILSVSGE